MNLPFEIIQKLEELYQESNSTRLKESAEKISKIYVDEFSNGGNVSSKNDILAYAITRMPATFGAVSSALSYMLEFIEDDISSVMDLGSGTGSALLACSLLLKNSPKLLSIEREKEMIDLSRALFSGYSNIEYNLTDFSANFPKERKSDLVIASYSLNELKNEKLDETLENIWNASEKYILIVEPGTPNASKEIRKIRQYFISKGGYVIAPCPHCNGCPIEENDWCHFATRVQRSKLHKLIKQVDSPFEDEKFAYIAISKQKCRCCETRIMRHPIITNGKINLTICDASGVHQIDVFKKNKEEYKKAKKLGNGDCL